MEVSDRSLSLSVIIPTHNRPAAVKKTIEHLQSQSLDPAEFEIIVVDDGSAVPVVLPQAPSAGPAIRLIRFENNQERSVARNSGVELATGIVVVFSDDDLIAEPDLLERHLAVHEAHEGLLVVGKIMLPLDRLHEPGVRYRQKLERTGIPPKSGLVSQPNFATAANMSIQRDSYLSLGGFDPSMVGTEDQDFAMRHSMRGGKIYYLAEAAAVHADEWLDFESFCRRQERGASWTVALSRRYPTIAASIEREKVNGPVNMRADGPARAAKKVAKSWLSGTVGTAVLSRTIDLLERTWPESRVLEWLYGFKLGVHLQRGYRSGLRTEANKSRDKS